MALFALLVVGVIVVQTWIDWRDAKKDWIPPEWVKGLALAGIVGVLLTAAVSFASVWAQDAASQWGSELGSGSLLLKSGFLLCALGVVLSARRKKRLRLMLLLTGVLIFAFWLGMTLSS